MLRLVYTANVLVAGWIGVSSLFFLNTAARTVFQHAYPPGETMRLVGCLWLAIAVLSGLGLWRPGAFVAVLVVQLVYKAAWLVVVVGPASRAGLPYPTGMAAFFGFWVVVLPFVIPWRALLAW